MSPTNPILTQGTWKVGRGFTIPINHPNWFQIKPGAPPHLKNQVTKVADLIDQTTASWKPHLIMQLYDRRAYEEILSIPIPKLQTPTTIDTLVWSHSLTGDYQVKKAYALLHQSQHLDNASPNSTYPHASLWKSLWKIKLPHKIITFT
jgi:hypothetical protein